MIGTLRHNQFTINMMVALVVFLNAIAPISVVAKEVYSSEDSTVEALFGDKIIICTPTGFKYISIDELNNRQDGENIEHQSHCPLCLIKVSASVLIAVDFENTVEFEHPGTADQVCANNYFQKPTSILSTANPRAPPLFL